MLEAIGWFLVLEPLSRDLLYAEPLRRRIRVRFGEISIADSEDFLLLFEPGRYPVAYFPKGDIFPNTYNAPSTPAGTTPTKRSEMARLLSVKVGLPRDIECKGRTVHTEACRVPRLNRDGYGQGDLAGHGVSSALSSSIRSNRIAIGRGS
jgi:hypothetical protein